MTTIHELSQVFTLNEEGQLVWLVSTSARNKPGQLAGNKHEYTTHKNIKYKCCDIIAVLKGESQDPLATMNSRRGCSANKPKKANTRKSVQDNPTNYFDPTKNEYLILTKIINKHASYYSKCSPAEYDDLVSEGWDAALVAMRKYDQDSNQSIFKTYCYHYIVGYMKNLVKKGLEIQKNELPLLLNEETGKPLFDVAVEDYQEVDMSVFDPFEFKIIELLEDGFNKKSICEKLGISSITLNKKLKIIKNKIINGSE